MANFGVKKMKFWSDCLISKISELLPSYKQTEKHNNSKEEHWKNSQIDF